MHIPASAVILFQGDSITDCGRNREDPQPNFSPSLGAGYAKIAAGMLLVQHADKNLAIHNRGVGGDRVTRMADRWRADCLDLKPDVLSILIGVNDTWHGTGKGLPIEVPLDVYEATYRKLLDDARQANPKVRYVLCPPFVLRCGAVDDRWFPEITDRMAIVKQIARDYDAVLVDFQAAFDEAVKTTAPDYWAADGVHPTLAGHTLMAQTWVEAVR